MADRHAMDDAAAAFAWMLPLLHADSRRYEYASGIVPKDNGYTYSEPRTSRKESEFRVPLPASMVALIHGHTGSSADENFSRDDVLMAKQLDRPSYIRTPTGNVRRYDPATGETSDVLAEFPWQEFKAWIETRYAR